MSELPIHVQFSQVVCNAPQFQNLLSCCKLNPCKSQQLIFCTCYFRPPKHNTLTCTLHFRFTQTSPSHIPAP
ncbi:hypothetical protein JHK85_006485 [Glycine max]|uniref:Uncharacterized protein n=2 Tax=Glycine subgen. Soja TaxID=1462606 RepID=A0A0R0KEQ6_SOYBN|nr:hypothetical protein JHK85_006485 [Glycine max]KAH1068582.1 hypothetical protein GYH30_006240 [Glycine max]RZC19086.1 hypothetical protein D0Y65_006068 [Glycine soja]